MLTRENLQNGTWAQSFPSHSCGQPRWSTEQLETSMQAALAQRPHGQPVRLFAYGSLIWNPLIHAQSQQPARLNGWQRRFCLHLFAGRASPQTPGRMLALAQGGQCEGIIYEFAEHQLLDELRLVWVREMIYGGYHPIWAGIDLPDGGHTQALVFVVNTSLPSHANDSSIAIVAPLIAQASGPIGSNLEYLLQLDATLEDYGVDDPYIQALATAAQA